MDRHSDSVTCGQGNAVWWATPSDRNASAAWLAWSCTGVMRAIAGTDQAYVAQLQIRAKAARVLHAGRASEHRTTPHRYRSLYPALPIGIDDDLSLSWIGGACVEAAFLGSCDAVFSSCRTTIIAVVARAGQTLSLVVAAVQAQHGTGWLVLHCCLHVTLQLETHHIE